VGDDATLNADRCRRLFVDGTRRRRDWQDDDRLRRYGRHSQSALAVGGMGRGKRGESPCWDDSDRQW
jgi:hypothetical protein